MKTLENVSVYICDHCKKRYLVKGACERHEKICYSNPENARACSNCIHVQEVEVAYVRQWQSPYGEHEEIRKTKGFFCKKLNKQMYPFKVERMGLPERFPESFEDQEPMPRVCEHETIF